MAMMMLKVMILLVLTGAAWRIDAADGRLLVNMTLVHDAAAQEALCLDGSLPAYHLHRGYGAGARNWLLQFEGGGWCNDIPSCLERANSRRGSTTYMTKWEVFSGILSNNASLNPEMIRLHEDKLDIIICFGDLCEHGPAHYVTCPYFYNWNRVKLRYCDGASFAGDSKFDNGTTLLYFRGQRIWRAIILDLLPKGLGKADKALLSGCSAGGLSAFLHCDNFTSLLPETTSVKCLSDAGLFLDERDISMNHSIRSFFYNLMFLQGVKQNLHSDCTSSIPYPHLCFFPQYALKYITTPMFILNSAYDVYQFHHILVPPSSDLRGHWNHCKLDPAACNANQIRILQGFRRDMLSAVSPFFKYSKRGGMFINSCFAHCQSESQDTWFAIDSPRVQNKTIAQAVGDWYFGRRVTKVIDCAYPCDSTCHNIIP